MLWMVWHIHKEAGQIVPERSPFVLLRTMHHLCFPRGGAKPRSQFGKGLRQHGFRHRRAVVKQQRNQDLVPA